MSNFDLIFFYVFSLNLFLPFCFSFFLLLLPATNWLDLFEGKRVLFLLQEKHQSIEGKHLLIEDVFFIVIEFQKAAGPLLLVQRTWDSVVTC